MLLVFKKNKRYLIISFIALFLILNVFYFLFFMDISKSNKSEGYVFIKPVNNLSNQELLDSAEIMIGRLNNWGYNYDYYEIKNNTIIFGISKELKENKEILYELVEHLIFEAKIGEKKVFTSKDVVFVHNIGEKAKITSCEELESESFCLFEFGIILNQDAAKILAEITKDLSIIEVGEDTYLSENITFLLDNKLVDEIKLSSNIKGDLITSLMITGNESGYTLNEARFNAINSMKKLQRVLISPPLSGDFYIEKVQ